MTKMVERHQVLALYKRVLKSHRLLPHDMKHLGDVYVKVEFRQHKDAKPQFVKQFIQEWTKYCEVCDFLIINYFWGVKGISGFS